MTPIRLIRTARMKGQQAGPVSSTCLSVMIPKHAFEVRIGDHKQPVGELLITKNFFPHYNMLSGVVSA